MSSAEAGGARWVVDVGDEDFEREVLERSRELPVVVDFWAPWCGPCRTLGPLLERLAEEHQGAFLLAKVDTDQAPYVAQGFGIRSIPTVMGFRDGEVVASFAGAQPEPALRDFLGQLLPSPADRSAREAEALRAAGDAAGAEALLRGALESEPRSGPALLALARLLMEREELEEAEALLERVVPVGKVAAERDQLAASLHIRRGGAADVDALRAAVAASPEALDPRLELGRALAARGDHEAALEELLELVRRDPQHADQAARKAMLDLFEVLGAEHDLTRRFRPALARALFR